MRLNLLGFTYEYDEKLVYCITAKAGCTSWKRIFRFLNHDYLKRVESPFDIPRIDVHLAPLKNTTVYHMNNGVERAMAATRYTFMFTRNPYTRLWSAYLDKIFLPDAWNVASNMIRARDQVSEETIRCPTDVSFYEFADFITSHKVLNPHWVPIHQVCSPCRFRFDFIGKVETFEFDRNFILKKFNIEHVLESGESDFASHRVVETASLIQNYFRVNRRTPRCLPEAKLAERLWIVFKKNGHISENSKFDAGSFIDEKSFLLHVTSVIKNDDMTPSLARRQREKAYLEAYRTLPLSLLYRIREFYELDFLIFGYDRSPSELGF